MATDSNILAWRIPGTERHGRLQSTGSQSWTLMSNQHFHFHYISNELYVSVQNSHPALKNYHQCDNCFWGATTG